MKLALMQPYFFPYLGYYQLIKAVDLFVVYDDVQFIKNGWINRNRILLNGTPHYITLPVQRGSVSDRIMDRKFVGLDAATTKIRGQIDAAYRTAPSYQSVKKLLSQLLDTEDNSVSSYLTRQLQSLAAWLGISTPIMCSSKVSVGDQSLSGQARVAAICKALSATTYINAMGGVSLYDGEFFKAHGIELRFLQTKPDSYPQFGAPFVPHLSIIDTIMFNTRDRVAEMLGQFEIIRNPNCVLTAAQPEDL